MSNRAIAWPSFRRGTANTTPKRSGEESSTLIYRFTLYFDGIGELIDDLVERLYDAGLDDGTPFQRGGEVGVGVDRESASLETAMASALADARAAGCDVSRVELDPADVPLAATA